MKKKKLVAVAAATLMAATAVGALAGCGDSSHTINVLLLADNVEGKFYEEYFKEMEGTLLNETGEQYKIKLTYYQEGQYYDKLGSKIASNSTPDIFYVRPNELLQYKNRIQSLQSYVDTAKATVDPDTGLTLLEQYEVDLDDVYQKALDMYRYNPTTGELGNHSDDLYAFPKDLSTQQLGYNKTLLSAYSAAFTKYSLKLPWEMDFSKENYTWDDYYNVCTEIASMSKPSSLDSYVTGDIYASDMPNIEILARSFGGGEKGALLDLSNGRKNATVNSIAEGTPIYQAIEYQAKLAASGAADYRNATYANFTAKRVCFYGETGSWQVSQYDNGIGKDDWGVMPWPTTDGSTNWEGRITSAGYVVSNRCKGAKADVAKRIAISFMSLGTQETMALKGVSLPLLESMRADYVSSSNDNIYNPSTREYFIDVISGDHGFFPVKYSTYDDEWLGILTGRLGLLYLENDPLASFKGTDWTEVQSTMQSYYNQTKNK